MHYYINWALCNLPTFILPAHNPPIPRGVQLPVGRFLHRAFRTEKDTTVFFTFPEYGPAAECRI